MKSTDSVTIGIIHPGSIDAVLALNLVQIAKIKGSHFSEFIQVQGKGQIARNRNKIVVEFLRQTNSEWLLMIDSDEALPITAYKKLVDTADDRTRKIVSALVFADFEDENGNKRPIPTIYFHTPETGNVAIDAYPDNQVLEVDAVGTGCLLIHRSILLDIQKNVTAHQGADWCWFFEGAINGIWFGEDLLFSKRMKSLGHSIFVHTGAIVPHHKDYWLDERHHAPIRDHSLSLLAEQHSTSSVPLAEDVPPHRR